SHYLAPLFEPRSVALVGASERLEKVGGRVLENLIGAGYRGAMHAVNPKYRSVRGIACVPSVADLPQAVDLAVVATPAPTVPEVIARCGERGIHAAIVITAGFSEAGPAGQALERELLAAARAHNVRILGPNCLGIMRPPLGLNATFARGNAFSGSLALVSQSGAVCTAMLDWATPNGVGFSSVISLGASSDIDFGEIIDYLASDDKTEHILLYIEGVKDGRRLVSSLRAAARVKPIIVQKVGRHPAGSRAAVSHTGAIVGRDDVFDAVVRRTGIVRVNTLTQLISAAQALASHVRPSGDRLAVITNGGGPGVMAADRAAELNLPLATLTPETERKLSAALPTHWSHGNPIDLIGDAGPDRYRAAVSACLEDPGVDGVVAMLTPQAMTDPDAAAQAVIAAASGAHKPVIACWMGESSVGAARVKLRQSGLPVFRGPEVAVETFAYLAQFYRNQKALLEAPGPLVELEASDVSRARSLVRAALAEGRKVLTPTESKALLAAFRVPNEQSFVATNEEEAARIADSLGYPVAMKVESPDITHKSDVGGVRLGLANAQAVSDAFVAMLAGIRQRLPQARIKGVALERMLLSAHSRELMVGIARDPVFGPAITFGAGGIAVEVLRDRAVALPPLNATLVDDMVHGTRIGRMLGRFRNLPAVDHAALEKVLLRVSEIACEIPEIDELDINPLVADEHGAIALDARVVLREVPAERERYAHLAIHPYPTELVSTVQLPDGTELVLRPIRPEDAEAELEFVEGLSPQSRRMRFQSALRTLTPSMLARFTQIDYDREMALVAMVDDKGRTKEAGVARYIRLPDGESCEYAIAVADEWQGRGLGYVMMERLIQVARERGIRRMMGWVLAKNSSMLKMCEELGFDVKGDAEDMLMRRVERSLA
ncbi:MAG TPA: bifunctional acetate--CoA ligase family protein/GNAT family N-acetyltransferase, partial [Usitatibacter sp.]|nr:bifunctional acetate--CoA ligase family protein/GNAT family N-acetyltransferase [Usitatibacter sp.]